MNLPRTAGLAAIKLLHGEMVLDVDHKPQRVTEIFLSTKLSAQQSTVPPSGFDVCIHLRPSQIQIVYEFPLFLKIAELKKIS